jgi:hypothetical protein
MKRHRQVRLEDRSDVSRPHHRSVTAEVDDFAIDALEVSRSARVASGPSSQAVMPGFEGSLGRVTALDAGDDLAVHCDIERSASKLYPAIPTPSRISLSVAGTVVSYALDPRRTGAKASRKHRPRLCMGSHPASSRRSRREGEAAQGLPRLRWLVVGMDVGHDRSIRLSASGVSIAVNHDLAT